jgi:transcriptional regulator with XRE-family HTH domain
MAVRRNHDARPDPRGIYVRAWRERKGLTLRELATRVGCAAGTILRIEQGHRLTPERQVQIAQALEIFPKDLERLPPADESNGGAHDALSDLPPGMVDGPLDQLGQAITAAVAAVLHNWQSQQEHRKWRDQQDYEADMLRRILLRASRTSPVEYPTRYTPEGDQYSSVHGSEEIVQLAIRLVTTAGLNPPTDPNRGAIIVTWRGATDPIGAVRDAHLRTQWVGAIRTALARGWDYIHCIQLSQDDSRALRSVLNVLQFLGPSNRYKPRLIAATAPELAHLGERDFVVVPGQGILELNGAESAHYYRPNQERSFEHLYSIVAQLVARSQPLYEQYERMSAERRDVRTQLEAAPGHRYLLMDGIPQDLVPPRVHLERYHQLVHILREQGASPERLQLAQTTLRNRKDREELAREQLRVWRHRDICPERAIRRLAHEGQTTANDVNDTLWLLSEGKLPPLTLEQRHACLSALVERLRKYRSYELVLLPDEQADMCGTYCLIKTGQAVLLQFWKPRRGGAANHLGEHVTIRMTDPTVVRAFATSPLLRPYGQELPSDNKRRVIALLQDEVGRLEERMAMQRPASPP